MKKHCNAFFVAHRRPASPQSPARIALKLLRENQELPKESSLADFCFPVPSEMHVTKRVAASEVYAFTMTSDTGDRAHGFCRKIYWSPNTRSPKFPIVLCIVSNDLWSVFYFKVLEVMEVLLLQERFISSSPSSTLSPTSAAAQFLNSVSEKLKALPDPGSILKIKFPTSPEKIQIEAPKRINALNAKSEELKSSSEFIELQVPPLTGGSPEMAGVSLARLLWRIPVQCLMTLIASLFLERRIIMVSTSKDTLSAAIHAASALIYPFEWPHRFYLPIMPSSMRDYLQAPFPFLVGLPAELMDFKGLEMDEVTLIDLDLGTCTPEPGSVYDDANHLPMKQKLELALHEAVRALRSPTEFEGNMRIAEVVTGYIVRLFKHYRQFIFPKAETTFTIQQRGCLSNAGSMFKRNGKAQRGLSAPTISLPGMNDDLDDAAIDGHGFYFDHAKFVASHRSKSDKVFLDLFRQSQMYEVFIRQRLEMTSLGVYPKDDPFEYKINLINEHAQKLLPGNVPHRNWSRRLPTTALSRKITSLTESRLRKVQTLAHNQQNYNPLGAVPIEPLETKSKRRLTIGNNRDKRFSKRQSIKNIVTEMAKQSTKNLKVPQPGNFLHQSRASFVERDFDDIPQFEHQGTLHYQSPSEPLISFKMEEESDTTDSDEVIQPVALKSRELSTIQSGKFSQSSQWDNGFESSAWPPRTSQSLWKPHNDSAKSFDRPQKMIGPDRSVRFSSASVQSNEPIPSEMRFEDEKKRQAEAFVESNLMELSSSTNVRLGVPTKPQNQTTPSMRFSRSNAFVFQ